MMAPERVLITGGAGFIGTHLAQHLLQLGAEVRVLDALLPQVHGDPAQIPSWMRQDCHLQVGDIRDESAVEAALNGVDAVVHLASETGTGQSMYAMRQHADVNVSGTATLLEALRGHPCSVRKLVVASSRAVYGEGRYECAACGPVYPRGRNESRLARGLWDPQCPRCGGEIHSVATDEDSLTRPTSVYGTTKLAQELLVTNHGAASGTAVIALRYQNVYGEGQSLANPYTGILTHFFAAVRRGQGPRVFEDGLETRDFVHVHDVIRATVLALQRDVIEPVLNVGSATRTSIGDLARTMCQVMGSGVVPEVVGEYRVGDIRHCVADLSRARDALGYSPEVTLDVGLRAFVEWAGQQSGQGASAARANEELARAGLLRTVR